MFHSARIKLTAWYLLILMSICIIFSVVIYNEAKLELIRSLHAQQLRLYYFDNPDLIPAPPRLNQLQIDPQLLENEENRIKLALVLINLGILVLTGGAGYFLAGRTLKPIQVMVDEQDRFITDASHELRTPLTALRAEIEVNLRAKDLSNDETKKILQSNLEEVIHLQSLSDNLLQLSQLEKSKGQDIFTQIYVSELISGAIKKVSSEAKRKHIVIESNSQNYRVLGDRNSLLQLMIILLDNAVKYSNDQTKIKIKTEQTDHKISIKIADQGIGIDYKDLPHIFERFYRADRSRTKQEISGYGLGLSIAKKIVTLHNGTISVKSNAKGTTFIILMPIVTQI